MLSDRFLSCLSLNCGQAVGWIKMKLGTEELKPRLRPHCVRWGPSSTKRGGHMHPLQIWPMYCGQTVVWIKLRLGPGGRPRLRPQCVTWGPISSQNGAQPLPCQFSVHVSCGQTAGWIKMPFGTEVCVGPGDNVLDGDPAAPRKGTTAPSFRSMSIVAKRSPI